MIKKIWYPTEEVVIIARYGTVPLLPILFLPIFFSGLNSHGALLILFLLFIIRGIISIRGAYTLPFEVTLRAYNKNVAVGGKRRTFYRFLSFCFPIVPAALVFAVPAFSYQMVAVVTIIATLFLGFSCISKMAYFLISFIYIGSSIVLSGIQGGIVDVIICVLLITLIYPNSIAAYIALDKYRELQAIKR
jgi:hypothetical protein